ncbi:glutamate receptor 3.7 [Ricinus communis]|uniref:Glutamate receptor n=1 Tax=Ricinus communis TaxID=3988 RepID=B9SDW1_RICCO|nr:glutamate receptor 3.7 [Ricinus communis]EEF38195.1 glutamate receptor 3 plant, putative [Ricinus communis]|eukprot:XP_002524180.1 glutamate receptor 3.7 [Ricinus communis]
MWVFNMRLMGKLTKLFSIIWVLLLNDFVSCQRPKFVNIGAVFTFDSVIGRVAKPAMEAAVSDINKDTRILNGTELKLFMVDAQCDVFLGSVGALRVLEKDVVAIIGPQSSGIAHMISQFANGLQVPLISYAATDPTLSALQFPFFVRTTQSDSYQMAAMAELVDFYGWKEVIGIYVDDDPGRNGINAFDDELEKKMAKTYKLQLSVNFDEAEITGLLKKSKSLGPRVYVVHVNPDPRMRIFTVAKKLQMMTDNYVWFATDWLSATVDSFSRINRTELSVLHGVVALRQHIPESSQKRAFVSRWREMQQKGLVSSELNTYGLQAYDTVWAVAYAIDNFINEFKNITFPLNHELLEMKTSELQLRELKIFNGGNDLLNKILQLNFTGLSGHIQVNQDRNIESGGYDVINIVHTSVRTVGYWSSSSGFSLLPTETHQGEQTNYSHVDQKLQNITWPGGKMEKPRGWEIADDERPLRIGVPRRASFVDFVTEVNQSHKIEGYCIDLFLEARKLIPYYVPYRFEPFGDGQSNPSYNELVRMVAEDVLDAAVGDIAIVTNRTKIVDFSQPYAASGLVILAPIRNSKSSAWVFLKPFTVEMWCVTAASFLMIAVVIWILEHRVNDEFRGPPRRQIVTMFMFSFSTLFKTNQETTISPLARMVMVVWLFVLMVITASYTASLTSILTVEQLSSPITGIDSLIASKWPIGYQVGSFAYEYLYESLYISRSRLVPLGTPEEYERALRLGPQNVGGVAAVVDELPYVELFLAKHGDFGIIGQPFTRGGWGFAFQRDSPLALDMSTAILKLSETGVLQKIHEKWFCKKGCAGEKRQKSEPNQLRLISFWGLYLLCGGVTLAALLLFLLRAVRQFVHYKRRQMQQVPPSVILSTTRCSQIIFHFFDFIDKKEEAIKKMFMQCDHPAPQVSLERS